MTNIKTNSINNAFDLLTDDAYRTKVYTLRSKMMNTIVDLIQEKGWTQKEAATHLNVSQPRISNLKNGEIDKFSTGMLVEMLIKLDFTFEFNAANSRK